MDMAVDFSSRLLCMVLHKPGKAAEALLSLFVVLSSDLKFDVIILLAAIVGAPACNKNKKLTKLINYIAPSLMLVFLMLLQLK